MRLHTQIITLFGTAFLITFLGYTLLEDRLLFEDTKKKEKALESKVASIHKRWSDQERETLENTLKPLESVSKQALIALKKTSPSSLKKGAKFLADHLLVDLIQVGDISLRVPPLKRGQVIPLFQGIAAVFIDQKHYMALGEGSYQLLFSFDKIKSESIETLSQNASHLTPFLEKAKKVIGTRFDFIEEKRDVFKQNDLPLEEKKLLKRSLFSKMVDFFNIPIFEGEADGVIMGRALSSYALLKEDMIPSHFVRYPIDKAKRVLLSDGDCFFEWHDGKTSIGVIPPFSSLGIYQGGMREGDSGGGNIALFFKEKLLWQFKGMDHLELPEGEYGFCHPGNLFFTKINPFKGSHVTFLVIKKERGEELLLSAIEEGKGFFRKMTHQMFWTLFIALLFIFIALLMITKKISAPIVALARLCVEVVKGEYSQRVPKRFSSGEVGLLERSFHKMVKGLREKERVRSVLNKVVSFEIAEEVLKKRIELGGEERYASVLFADIHEFTHMASKMTPREVIDLLNELMQEISYVVDRHRGVIDKYIGDEAMALFGVPLPLDEHPYEALLAALEIKERVQKWNVERDKKGLFPVEVGIGVHTGNLIAGTMGAPDRLNYTVIGSNVNLAKRLSSVTKTTEVLVTKETLEALKEKKERFLIHTLPKVHLKGIEGAIEIFRIEKRI